MVPTIQSVLDLRGCNFYSVTAIYPYDHFVHNKRSTYSNRDSNGGGGTETAPRAYTVYDRRGLLSASSQG